MDYKEKYEQGLECIQEILSSGQEKIKITLLKERLLPFFPELESEDDKIRKKCINFLNLHKRFHASSAEIDECIAWLKKQKVTDKEIVFRPLAGTDIIAAANQAIENSIIEIGKEVILAFNGAYIPVNGKTVAEICNEYFAWLEKQGNSSKKCLNLPHFTFDDVLALQCCMETVKKVQEDKELYEQLQNLHNRLHDAYWLEKQDKHLENYDEAEKEKAGFVGDGFIECQADFLDFKEGDTYWLEYIGDDKYNVRSDNLLGKTYHITPCQLYTIFKKQTWLEKQGKNINVDSILEKIGVKPAYLDGNSWCILHGDNIQNGICGFGYTKEEALIEFLKDLLKNKDEQKPTDKVEPKFKIVEYVYILDYCSGRVMVVKHSMKESILDLFKRLGLKESQCQYMVSTDILSIEYINF